MIETSLAVVSANLPLTRPLIRHFTNSSFQFWTSIRSLRTKGSDVGSMEPVTAAVEQEVKEEELGRQQSTSTRSEFSFEKTTASQGT